MEGRKKRREKGGMEGGREGGKEDEKRERGRERGREVQVYVSVLLDGVFLEYASLRTDWLIYAHRENTTPKIYIK